jgi:hypothetical protein
MIPFFVMLYYVRNIVIFLFCDVFVRYFIDKRRLRVAVGALMCAEALNCRFYFRENKNQHVIKMSMQLNWIKRDDSNL